MSKKKTLWIAAGIAVVLLIFIIVGTYSYNTNLLNPKGKAAHLSSYLIQQDTIRDRMLRDMDFAPSGNMNQDFLTAVQIHHQATLDMCENYLDHGCNLRVKKKVRKIIKEKNIQLEELQNLSRQELPATTDPESYEVYLDAYNTMLSLNNHVSHGTTTDMTVEEAFAQDMINHHKLAVAMSDSVFSLSYEDEIKNLAKDIVATENKENELMLAIQ